jgi:hypothetical protein
LAVSGLLVWGSSTAVGIVNPSQNSYQPEIRSGQAGFCLDDYHNSIQSGAKIDSWTCNGTDAQAWYLNGNHITKSGGKYCLSEQSGLVVLARCSAQKNQDWSAYGVGLKDAANDQCLSLPDGKTQQQLKTANCNGLNSLAEVWTPAYWQGEPIDGQSSPSCNQSDLGQRIACVAEAEWLAWQTEPKLHAVLLNDYTDGNPNEEWCADFVSFVYKQAGDAFIYGERGNGGWDEYNANLVINEPLTYHAADSGYLPKPGDIAYFNYSGGHVEIVVSGGQHPTFIYGDSGTIDPITGNGTMAENQIVNDGNMGSVQYYLSPD